MRIGLVGYGDGGRYFHAPFIAAARGVELAGIVARSPERLAAAAADYPDVPVYPSLTALLAAGGVDAVTITTPPQTRRELVMEAIAAGVHVVADKPFAPDADGARQLDAAAKAGGVVLGVFHNRRYDADFRTLKKLVDGGRLGRLWRVHSRMDLDNPHTLEAGPTGGLLRDLGSHLVDQMLFLLGPVAAVDAQLDMIDRPEGPTDASFTLTLRHESGVHSHLSASKLNRLAVRSFRVYGDGGSYEQSGTDVQAQAIFAGRRPLDDLAGWGYETEALWGTLRTAAGAERVPSEQGRYHDYYEGFARAVAEGTPPPVTAAEATEALAVLDAARVSATEGRTVRIE
ncbi:Oxidoreductase family, NAD-binding Rossmann fold domain protein [uncultured Pleomorphomonas sp.]|uniref:Oxidoreductase family, NAD-binding Rossmann fold domain protein n=1 Tax=uncultured Pleomorphomonas sp. TaxID=442121 RepID=A0A212LH35_9HYPH|nr:Gfo/Idh/MocA family oxidoreductase [uncultured Pleomorphomonas sp.]SCM76864.1 Oxidoreductase family, NAD-binding Rossmann fold domain protein [uncultured Pleomorphomonas sp.]